MAEWQFGNTILFCLAGFMTLDIQVRSTNMAVPLSPDLSTANYLNDLWIFDMQEYKWKQIVMKDNERKPSWVSDSSSSKILFPTLAYQPEEWIFLPPNPGRNNSPRYVTLFLPIYAPERRYSRWLL